MIIRILLIVLSYLVWPLRAEYQLPEVALNQPLHISKGANAGFVADQQCANCHQDKYQSFQHVGMAKSFKTPKAKHFIEDFTAKAFYHSNSKRYYQISRDGDDLWFKRYQLDSDKQPINEFKQKISYMIGSGNKTRSYFYRTAIGELYLLPLSWYSATQSWQMSPGFEKSDHIGITRQVTRECMFCHNALPEVPKDSDWHWQAQIFPQELPQGIGCQRCHGPGGEHIKTVTSGKADIQQIHHSIVNPAKLAPQLRDSVCFQCHMLPAVSMAGVRQYQHTDYGFRAGQSLKDFLVHVDVEDANIKRQDRFEINHHGYRLAASQCFTQSQDKLTCISCHDPHVKVQQAQKVAHYGKACMSCHQGPHPQPSYLKDKNLEDCTSCHMPQRRTQDVVHAVMTDHRIGIYKVDESFVAPVEKQQPDLTDIELFFDYPDMSAAQKQMYKLSALVRAVPSAHYIDYFKSLLVKHQPKQLQPYFDLIAAQLAIGDSNEALKTITFVEQKFAENWRLKQWKVKALIGAKQFAQANRLLQGLLIEQPDIPEHHLYHGVLLQQQRAYDQAIVAYQRSCQLRPVMVTCWFNLGALYHHKKHYMQAMEAYQKALAIDPNIKAAYISIAQIAVKSGDIKQARRYLRHGLSLFANDKTLLGNLSSLSAD